VRDPQLVAVAADLVAADLVAADLVAADLVAAAGRPGRARTWWPCLHVRPGGRLVFACHVQTGPQLVAVARRPPTWCTWCATRWPPAGFRGPWAASRRPGATARRPGSGDHGPRGLAGK